MWSECRSCHGNCGGARRHPARARQRRTMVVARALRAAGRHTDRIGERAAPAARPGHRGGADQRRRDSLLLGAVAGRQDGHDSRPRHPPDARAGTRRSLPRCVRRVLRRLARAHGICRRGDGAGRVRSVARRPGAARGRARFRRRARVRVVRLCRVSCGARHRCGRVDRAGPDARRQPPHHRRRSAAEYQRTICSASSPIPRRSNPVR